MVPFFLLKMSSFDSRIYMFNSVHLHPITMQFFSYYSLNGETGNIFECDQNLIKFIMIDIHGTYHTVSYQSFKKEVE